MSSNITGAFGERLRRLRVAAGLTTADLAYRAGVTEGAIRQIESGRTKSPSFLIGLKLAEILEVDPWELATGVKRNAGDRNHAGSVKDRVARLEAQVELLSRSAPPSPGRARR